jgi:ribosome-binding protein aMBF1 (putative translation factor)
MVSKTAQRSYLTCDAPKRRMDHPGGTSQPYLLSMGLRRCLPEHACAHQNTTAVSTTTMTRRTTKRPEQPEQLEQPKQDERDAKLMRVFRDVVRSGRYAGAPSLKDIAEMLNAKGIATPRGGRWTAMSVAKVLDRAQEARKDLSDRPE